MTVLLNPGKACGSRTRSHHAQTASGSNGSARSNGHSRSNGRASSNGHRPMGLDPAPHPTVEHPGVTITSVTPVRDAKGEIRYFRHGTIVTHWEIKHELPGRLRLKNPVIHRKGELCQAIERELMSVLGIDYYKTNPLTSTVLVHYDRRQLTRDQIIEILETALANAEHPAQKDKLDLHLPLCTASVPLAAAAQFAAPAFLPAAAVLFAYTSIPTFKAAREVLFEEKRLGVDVLDAIVVVGCLGTMAIFPGAVLCWCLSFGRVLVKKTQDNSKKLLLNAFGKQPRYVWLYRDGAEVQISLDRLQPGDVIVVNTGEVVPVDGIIVQGMAMIDQHALTGESTPAEKGVGDRVFASTLMVAGKVLVQVEKSGSETASAKISQILNDTAGYKLSSQHKGERLADKAVIPTLAVGAVGMATMGPGGAVAVLNSDFGTGIRMAAPLAMLSSLALCANKGILVKDGRALELMNEVDTVLFDKTGTLTRERPEVGRIIASHGFAPERILQFAAAAERKFHHPIALAILHKAQELDLELPPTDDTQYKVGYGITVAVEGHTIRVGSKRFMELEGVAITPEVDRGPGAGPPRRTHDGDGGRRRQAGRGDRAARGGPARGPADHPGAAATAGSSTSRSSRATMRPPPASWPSRWAWTATSPRSCPPTRPTTSRSSRRKAARSASWATESTTRSHSRRRTCRSRCAARRRSPPTRPTSSSWRKGSPSSATCATSPATWTATCGGAGG